MTENKKRRKKLLWLLPLNLVTVLIVAFLIYSGIYYHAGSVAEAALSSEGTVQVSKVSYGWFFDGPSEEAALIFYPGAKVEAKAYAPLLLRLAAEGMDVCLVEMPLRYAFFGMGRARAVMNEYEYSCWYIGGHSLGGAMAASYAAEHPEGIDGVILLGAYAPKLLDDNIAEIVIYGSEDRIVSMKAVEKGRETAPNLYTEHIIQGGNHAQFGDYGVQPVDGTAAISPEEQWSETVRSIMENVK